MLNVHITVSKPLATRGDSQLLSCIVWWSRSDRSSVGSFVTENEKQKKRLLSSGPIPLIIYN